MSGQYSKNKGKSGERELCKILEKYLGAGFSRSMNSGAYIGKSNAHRKQRLGETAIRAMKADLITPDNLPKMVIESKWYKELPMHNLIRQGVPQIDEWIADLEYDCDEDDYGFIAIKLNRKGWIILFKESISTNFNLDNYLVYNGYIITDLTNFLEKNYKVINELCQ